MAAYWRKYATGTGADIYIPQIARALVDYQATWTPAAGDVKISIDGAAEANIATLPVVNNTYDWKFVFSNAELTGKTIRVRIVDSATKVIEDNSFTIETYGHASALHPFDLGTASTPQTGDAYAVVNSGTHGNAALKALIDAIDDYIDSEVAAILADTNELQTDWANGGRLDLILDARASQSSVDDVPTVSEFNARTLPAADYFDPAADAVAVVTTLTNKTGFALTDAYDVYHAEVNFTRDQANTTDEYTITWFKNGIRVAAGITVPTIQVVKRADGTDLIATATPTQIGSTGSYKHDATLTNRVTVGEAVVVIVGATIDGSARSFSKIIGRDSA